ncbi:outer membrane protein assembly factor BamA [Desulfovibrio sp. OttesenSCG-928-A18]|nr:outer membrane protein assembly factor BamA [Desulfovibrio sp. OttesenSCG-928-A18]
MSKCAERFQTLVALMALAVLGLCFAGPSAHAAPATTGANKVLVLPFQVHAGSNQETLALQFPEMLGARLSQSGTEVVSHEQMLRLVKSRNVSTLDLATVRALAKAAGASHAVYGSVNQAGDALSIDARLVSAQSTAQPKPIFVDQGAGNTNLSYALDDLAGGILSELPTPVIQAAPGMPGMPGPLGSGVVAGVEVRGTKVLEPDVVLLRVSTRRGDVPDPAVIDQDVKRIWELGYFSDVSVELQRRDGALFVIYTVTEKPRVETITVEGTEEFDEEDIIGAMSTQPGSVLNDSVLAEDIQKILEMYRKKGYYLAKVDTRFEPRSMGTAINLNISEGKKLYISAVHIEGASQLDESDVKKQLLMSERSIISWFTGTGVLQEELIERDSAAITAYYLDHGFMDITVAAPRIEYSDDGISVTFPIHEGQKYNLTGVSFEGELIDTTERLRELISLDEVAENGGAFNLTMMQKDARKISEFYANYGYAFAEVNPRPMKSVDGSNTVSLVYEIKKKHKIYVRRVLVEGNNKTRDNVVLREMRLTDGEQFEGEKLRRSVERLNKLGYFEMAEAELVQTANPDEVDLKIKVKEQPTGALMAGFGYSTFSDFGVAGTLMEKNLWGKGYNVSLKAAFSGRRDAYTFSFTNPRFNDTPLSLGVDLYHWRDDYIDYVKRTTGGVLRAAYPIGEYTSVGVGYRLDRYKIYDVDDDASSYIKRYDTGNRWTSVLMARIMRDSTNRENPTSGNIDSLSVEYGGGLVGGDDDFILLSAEHQTYYELATNHVLHLRIKGSALLKNGSDEVPVFERFWMGGMQSVRGYNSRHLVPRDPDTDDRIGGTRMAFANFEYIWTVSTEYGLSLVPFFDIGFNIDSDHDYSWSDEVVKSAGLELRWRSPMGDLRFSYGIPFDEDRRGKRESGRFEFSMGQFF